MSSSWGSDMSDSTSMVPPGRHLTIASMWEFEDRAVQEIQDTFMAKYPEYASDCRYSQEDHLIITKVKAPAAISKLANIVSEFVEAQKDRPILDEPSIKKINDGIAHKNRKKKEKDTEEVTEEDTEEDSPKVPTGELISVDRDSEKELIRHSLTRICKPWTSQQGGLGCFGQMGTSRLLPANVGVLDAVAGATGTVISVDTAMNCVKVSGKNDEDVHDALGKLTRCAYFLSIPPRSRMQNLLLLTSTIACRVRFQRYGSLNNVWMNRVMGDVSFPANIPLEDMFTTVLLGYDVESQRFRVPDNLLNPPQISAWNPDWQPTMSKPWRDYTFPELGSSVRYSRLISEGKQPDMAGSEDSRYLEMERSEQDDTLMTEKSEVQPTMSDDLESVVSQAQPSVVAPSSPIECQAPVPMDAGEQTRYKWKTVYSHPLAEESVSAGSRDITVENPEPETPSLDRSRFGTFDPYRYGHPGSSTVRDGEKDSLDVSRIFEQRPGEVSLSSSTDLLRGAAIATSWDQWKDVQQNPPRRPADLPSGVSRTFPQSAAQISPSSVDFPKGAQASKYSSKRGSKSGYRGGRKGSRNTLQAHSRGVNDSVEHGHKDPDQLIDLSSPDVTSPTHMHYPLTFNQAPLVPDTPTGQSPILEESRGQLLSSESRTAAELAPTNENERRFVLLREPLGEDLGEEMPGEDIFTSAPSRLRNRANTLVEQWIETQRPLRPETESAEGPSPRQYHRTMQQKMGKTSNSKTKAEKAAERRATLDDAWGAPIIPSQGITNESVQGQKKNKDQEDSRPAPFAPGAFTTQERKDLENSYMSQTSLAFFEALEPSLEFAEYFQGAVNLEIQIGLILIPRLPRTFEGGLITLGQWDKLFRPQTGVYAPGTTFINAVTTSAIDVDYIIDLHTSTHDGSRIRLFDEEYTDYSVVYEIRCRTKKNQIITIVIDETGTSSVKLPAMQIGKVNIHFPGNIWDACTIVSGINQFVPGSDPELDEAIKYFVDNFYVEPDRTLVCFWASMPEGKVFEIEKVFVKRWTRHRYIRPEPNTIYDDGQDLFLQVTEVQALATGLHSDESTVRARALPAQAMIDEDRQWYEVSLVSPAIETVLSSNTSLEVGERTREWCAADLLGKDAVFLPSTNPDSSPSLSPVASAIGNAGLDEMLTLTRHVVENMDAVGNTNYGSYAGLLPEPDPALALPEPPSHSETIVVPYRALPPVPKVEDASKDVQTSSTECVEKDNTGISSCAHTPVKTAPLTSPVYATAPTRMRTLDRPSDSDPVLATTFDRVPASQTVPKPAVPPAARLMHSPGLAESSSMPDESCDSMSILASEFDALTIHRPAPEPAPVPAQERAPVVGSTPVKSPRQASTSSAPTPTYKRGVTNPESTPTRSPSVEQSQPRALVMRQEQDSSSAQGVQTSRVPTQGPFYEKYILGAGGFW